LTITRQIVPGCCGNSFSIVFYLDKPLKKEHIAIFEQNNYVVPKHYVNSGIFYARKDTLTANSTFGTTKVSVKCGVHNREQKLNEFQAILEQAINS
jgi:hypothetical protein